MNIPLVLKLQEEHNIELTRTTGPDIVAVTAKELSPTVKQMLRDALRDAVPQPVQFVVGIKLATREKIHALLSRLEPGLPFQMKQKEGTVEVDINADVSEVWQDICEALEKDGFPKSWKVGDRVYDKKIVAEANLRPKRDRAIGQEDLTDLTIMLGAAKTVDEFLKML